MSSAQHQYAPNAELIGHWQGFVRTHDEQKINLQLQIQADGDIHVSLGDQYTTLLASKRYNNRVLEGWFPGILPGMKVSESTHDIAARLFFEKDRASGYFSSSFFDATGVYELPNYVELEKQLTSD